MLKYPGTFRLLVAVGLGVLCALPGLAAAQHAVTISIGDAAGNPGDSAEIQVNLATGAAQPAAMILFFTYDNSKLEPIADYYQFVDEDLQGNPVTKRSAVRPGPVLDQADKLIMTEVAPGEVAVAIFGLNETTVASGGLLTIAFEILSAAQIGDELIVAGDPDSSASPANAETMAPIGVVFESGFVSVGCLSPPAPTNISATSNRSDGVLVSWSGIGIIGAEYRVFRSDASDGAGAQPLGDSWQTGTTFLDVSAALPVVTPPPGCGGEPIVDETRYYYWVKSRTSDGCESDLAGPAEGVRAAAKQLGAAIVPFASAGNGLVLLLVLIALLALTRRVQAAGVGR
jgi:hypothetical protein